VTSEKNRATSLHRTAGSDEQRAAARQDTIAMIAARRLARESRGPMPAPPGAMAAPNLVVAPPGVGP
jgi:hypothetical protein